MGCSFSAPYSKSKQGDVSYKSRDVQGHRPSQNAASHNWDSAASAMENGQHKPSVLAGGSPIPSQNYVPLGLKRQPTPKTDVSQPPSQNGVKLPAGGGLANTGLAQTASNVDYHNRQGAALQSLPSKVTQELSQYRDSDDESDDWDRVAYGEDEGYSSGGQTAGSSAGRRLSEVEPNRRAEETSIFGLTNKRRQEPLRETRSLKLAKLRGCTFVNQYVVIKYLGRGACGRVFLCMDMNDNRLYAVKIVKKVDLEAQRGPRQNQRRKRNPIDDLRREVSIMKTLRHKNIVTLQEVVDDPSGSKMLLVMDYMEGGPVMTREALERGRCIPESLACQYFRDMCKALDYLHFFKVVHGDLKPENVLMSARGSVTLSDFGCSKVIISGNEYLERCNGTPAFLAPEMMRPQSRYRGRPTDMYALGACLYTFVFGRIPFNAPNVFKLFQIVQNEPLAFPSRPVVSPLLQDLLLRLLHKDPKQRITMSQVMKHPWVTKRGQWPLKSVKEMVKETGKIDEDDVVLPDLMSTYNVLDVPRQDHLLDVLQPGLPEHTFKDGEILLRQGDQGTHLMYILSGEVEVLVKLPPIRDSRPDSGRSDKNGLQSRESGHKTDPPEVIGDDLPPALLEGASKAKEFTSTLAQGPREYLVAVRKEGQFVGEMSSFTTAAARCATVRAKGSVKVKLIPGELLHDCVERIPEARQQAKEMLWMRQSENMVLEAMTRLSAVHDALEEMLESNSDSRRASAEPRSSTSSSRHNAGRQTFRR